VKKILLLLALCLALSYPAAAVDYYNVQHWLIGSLEAGQAPSADNQTVHAFYPSSSDATATDISGAAGKSGLPNRYMINAFEIPSQTYAPGLPVSGEVRGLFRAGPAGVVGSTAGYDVMPAMSLRQAINLDILAIAESGVNLRDKDYFSEKPDLSVKMVDPTVKDLIARTLIELKDAVTHQVILSIDVADYLDEYHFAETLKNGTYDLTATVYDGYGNSGTKTINELKVTSDYLIRDIIADKLPWKPKHGEKLKLAYVLSREMPLAIYGINISGEFVKSIRTTSGIMGGRAGYNEITLDGTSDLGGELGNGIYLINFTTGNKMLGKYKIVVAD